MPTNADNEQKRLEGIYEKLRLRLLDLTRRNRMLNYTFSDRSKSQLRIIDEVLEEVYRRLTSEDDALHIAALPEPDGLPADEKSEEFITALAHATVADMAYLQETSALNADEPGDEAKFLKAEAALRDRVRQQLGLPSRPGRQEFNRNQHARTLGINPNLELLAETTEENQFDGHLQTLRLPDELERTLDKIARDANLAEQEMGVSTLFLAFGFLEWYQSDDSDVKSFAPLILLPAKLDKQRLHGRVHYTVSARESQAEANLSLQKLLEMEFTREIPTFATGDDGGSGSVEAYFDAVRVAIEGLKRWKIRRWLVLGQFAFGRFAMYNDLDPKNWKVGPVNNPLVGSVLRGTDRESGGGDTIFAPAEDYPIDDPEIEKIAPYLVSDADASQHSAIIDVMKGANLVIQGPPGTGKSQTITNIIANALAKGQKVLFMSEKQAALEVVKRRLDMASLGEFCLALHSDKSSPKEVIKSLKERIELGRAGRPARPFAHAGWAANRKTLSGYLDALHSEHADGESHFSDIWKSAGGQRLHGAILRQFSGVSLPVAQLSDQGKRSGLLSELELFARQATSYADLNGSPWKSIWQGTPIERVGPNRVGELIEALEGMRAMADDLAALLAQCHDLGILSLPDLATVVAANSKLPSAAPEHVRAIAACDLDQLEPGLRAMREILEIEAALILLPDTLALQPSAVACAKALAGMNLAEPLLSCEPRKLFKMASDTLARNSGIVFAIEAMLPILRALDLDATTTVAKARAVAEAVIALLKLPAAWLTWYATADRDEDGFPRLFTRWQLLCEQDLRWRNTLAMTAEQPWPTGDDLRAAAQFAGRSRFVKALTRVPKEVAATANRLRIELKQLRAGMLEELAQHAESLMAFQNDSAATQILGPFWSGFTSPFDDIEFGWAQLRAIRSTLASALSKPVVTPVQKFIRGRMREFSSYRSAAETFARTMPVGAGQFDNRQLTHINNLLQEQRRQMTEVLDSGIEHHLSQFQVPTGLILKSVERTAARHVASQRLDRLSSGSIVRRLVKKPDDVEACWAALQWIRNLKACALPPVLFAALSSEWADTVRARVNNIAKVGSVLLEKHAELSRRIYDELDFTDLQSLAPHTLSARLDALLAARGEVHDFIQLQRFQEQLRQEYGLGPFLDKAGALDVPPADLKVLLEVLHSKARAERSSRAIEPLKLSGLDLGSRRSQFAEQDREKIKYDRRTLRLALLTCNPADGTNQGPRGGWTELALLRNEFDKQKRFIPLRSLLSRAGKSIQELKPCFMMSPLSLAKFSSPDMLDFDLLIIDEASQMKPEDALGGLLRAKQTVVVGDLKQLPPSDFFNRADKGQSDSEDESDESILENCQKAFRKVRRLAWHYRSRCESLIRFANENFYDRKLITFPAPVPGSFSVDLVRVNGAYQSNRNPAEAAAITEAAVRFMRDRADCQPDDLPSLGLVAVNSEQRDLIEEEFGRLTAGDSRVELYLATAKEKGEEFFIKNLENVQGDERDHIFISMTYGREPGATVLMQHFGPINRKQGHRRLNVLFSRARSQIGLFCSFGSEDVRPSESSSEGVHVLKNYLKYVEARGLSLGDETARDPDSDFEREVKCRLEARGYSAEPQVGVSKYRIDLGIRHPDYPSRFLAGIECDGAAYHSSKSARDRDRLREEVLRGKGWNIIRVWSTDWFIDSARETEKLIRQLEDLRRAETPQQSWFVLQSVAATPQSEISAQTSDVDASLPAENSVGHDLAAGYAGPGIENASVAPVNMEIATSASSLNELEAKDILIKFRDQVIVPESPSWQMQRSILREGMIEAMISQRLDDPDDWFKKVPSYLRQATNPTEKAKYLEQICDIISRLRENSNTSSVSRV